MARPWRVLSGGGCRSDVVRQESVKGRSGEAGGTGSSQTRDAERSDRAGSGGGGKWGGQVRVFLEDGPTGFAEGLEGRLEGEREKKVRRGPY